MSGEENPYVSTTALATSGKDVEQPFCIATVVCVYILLSIAIPGVVHLLEVSRIGIKHSELWNFSPGSLLRSMIVMIVFCNVIPQGAFFLSLTCVYCGDIKNAHKKLVRLTFIALVVNATISVFLIPFILRASSSG